MPHENPWFIITRNELLMIQEGLFTLEKELPLTGSQHLGNIISIVRNVRDRQP
jgi:hypothetical protein